MDIIKFDQVADRLPGVIAKLAPGDEIMIVDGNVALAKVMAPTRSDLASYARIATDEPVDDSSLDDIARYMT